MNYPINIKSIPTSIEFYSEIIPSLERAQKFLKEHRWCEKIYNGWLFTNIGYAVGIFLFEIENTQSAEDNLIWVIVGDFPAMYLDTYSISTTKEVVEKYIELATEWIENAENGDSLEECYPLNATPDKESIDLLKIKIRLLKEKILPNIDKLNFESVQH